MQVNIVYKNAIFPPNSIINITYVYRDRGEKLELQLAIFMFQPNGQL